MAAHPWQVDEKHPEWRVNRGKWIGLAGASLGRVRGRPYPPGMASMTIQSPAAARPSWLAPMGLSSPMGVFVAGVQKGGTSALHAYLAGHPDLCPPPRKELHFFDDETRDWRWPCRADLDAAAPGDGRLRFEATPISLFWPGALERLAGYNPWARLILLFRCPVQRAWSHWCMEYARGVEHLPFATAIRGERQRLRDEHSWRSFSYVERGRYGAQLAHALALFPRRQMLFLRSQDLAAQPWATLGRVSAFLGIAPFGPVAPLRVNQRPGRTWPALPDDADRRLIMDELGEDLARFARLSGVDVAGWGQGLPGGGLQPE
jgi:hypothetical protein